MSFENLKRNRGSDLDKLAKQVQKTANGGGGYEKDTTYWSPTVDKAGNGTAVIRFLPGAEGDEIPYVQLWTHSFKGPGGWYIENSRTTLGGDEKDPCGELNSELWNSVPADLSDESKKEHPARKQAGAQKRKLNYISNILVIKDPGDPSNEGKVFKYKYGKKIFEKINNKMNPPEDDIKPFSPFDFWDGANFRLRIRKVDGQRNYDTSEFDAPSELFDGDDARLEELYKNLYSLKALVAPDQFKSYDELKKRLDRVLGNTNTAAKKSEETEVRASLPQEEEASAPEPQPKAAKQSGAPAASQDEEDEDVGLDYFNRLAAEDDDVPF
jgi:hypothetical protein